MKLKELESYLSQMDGFQNPKLKLEQYETQPHIAAHLIHHAVKTLPDSNLSGMTVVDLGTGTGRLGIGAALLGAEYVLGIDVDQDALEICRANIMELAENFTDDETNPAHAIDLLNMDLNLEDDVTEQLAKKFDVALLNPPFGTKNNAGIDMKFLKLATKMATHSVFSLHKSSTRDHILKKIKQWGLKGDVMAKLRFDLPASYKMHRKSSVDIEVDVIRVLI